MLTPPVLVLGGVENALSIVRGFGRKNIPVRVSAEAECPAQWSRFCKDWYKVPSGKEAESYWGDLLLGASHSGLSGSVLFACSDDAVAFLANHRKELDQTYLLDDFDPTLHLAMLDKQKTLELARSTGCPAPRVWKADTREDVGRIPSDCLFPVIIKPIYSHLFQRAFGRKFFVVHSHQEMADRVSESLNHGLRVMVCELIPGLDSVVTSSYYTYTDRQGQELFRFTKRVLRRYPVFGGGGSFHMTQWLPETAEMGERFFRGIGFRGLGCVEFKRDPRDGLLKVIECNPRFTGAHELLVRCEMDPAFLIYCSLTNRPLPRVDSYEENLGLWYPVRDLKAFLRLRSQGDLSTLQWLRSVSGKQVFPFFSLRDPWPSIGRAFHEIRDRFG